MRLRAAHLYSALAVAFALAFGIEVGAYWVDDALGLAAFAFITIMICVSTGKGMQSLTSWWAPKTKENQNESADRLQEADYRRYIPRSKIAHFVLLSRIRFRSMPAWDTYNQFERRLLKREGWQSLSPDDLKALAETPE